MKKLLVFCLLTSFMTLASDQKSKFQDDFKRLEQEMQKQQEMMKELFQGSFEGVDKMLNDFRKRMAEDDFFQQMDEQFLDRFNSLSFSRQQSYEWIETEKERILSLTIPISKNRPVDISIDQNQIKLEGVSEVVQEQTKGGKISKRTSISQFSHVIPTPNDVDVQKARVEHNEKGLKIFFPKVKGEQKINRSKEDQVI